MNVSTNQRARETVAFVLAGGRGSRFRELTDKIAKPAVFFGGRVRIIDFALSNPENSGIPSGGDTVLPTLVWFEESNCAVAVCGG